MSLDEVLKQEGVILGTDDTGKHDCWYPVGVQPLPKSFGSDGFMLYNSYNTKTTISKDTIYKTNMGLVKFLQFMKYEIKEI